jgi:hypothetical protein
MRHPNKRRQIAARKREARAFYELRRQKREHEAPPTFEKPPETDNGKMFAVFVIALALAALVALAQLVL